MNGCPKLTVNCETTREKFGDIFGAKVPEKYMNIIMSAAKGLVDKAVEKNRPIFVEIVQAAGVIFQYPGKLTSEVSEMYFGVRMDLVVHFRNVLQTR